MSDPKFTINRRTSADIPGEYDDEVAALIAADEELTEEEEAQGVFNSITVQVPATRVRTITNDDGTTSEETIDATPRYKRFFQNSAKAKGFTAREVTRTDSPDDNAVLIEFRLVELVKRPRGGTEADTAADVPQEGDAA